MNQHLKKAILGDMHLRENVEFVLRDKDGHIKPLFQLNTLGHFLMKKGYIHPHTNKLLLRILGLGYWSNSTMLVPNLVTNAGKAVVASRFGGADGEAAVTYIAIGTGTASPAATDTTLGAEITTGGGARAAATVSRVTTTVTNDTAQAVVTFSFTSSFAVTESALFNAASGADMVTRDTFTAINVVTNDSLQLTHKVAVA